MNLSYAQLDSINLGQSVMNRTVYGATWHFHKRFQATLGVTRTVHTDSKGRPFQTSDAYNYVSPTAAPSTGATLGADINNRIAALPNKTLSGVKVENIAGRLAEYKQVWIRSEYKY